MSGGGGSTPHDFCSQHFNFETSESSTFGMLLSLCYQNFDKSDFNSNFNYWQCTKFMWPGRGGAEFI